jgi:hypothetical protein
MPWTRKAAGFEVMKKHRDLLVLAATSEAFVSRKALACGFPRLPKTGKLALCRSSLPEILPRHAWIARPKLLARLRDSRYD